jgi:hypothetical protein
LISLGRIGSWHFSGMFGNWSSIFLMWKHCSLEKFSILFFVANFSAGRVRSERKGLALPQVLRNRLLLNFRFGGRNIWRLVFGGEGWDCRLYSRPLQSYCHIHTRWLAWTVAATLVGC